MNQPTSLSKEMIAAVIISRDPDPDFPMRVGKTLEQIREVILIDNASGRKSEAQLEAVAAYDSVTVRKNGANLGVATALNQGIQLASERGYGWVLALDQDSLPENDMIEKMISSYSTLVDQEEIAILAPRIIDAKVEKEGRYLRRGSIFGYRHTPCENGILDPVTMAITSGALLNLSAYSRIGGFREEFFIDYVDTEFCLRAVLSGYRIVVCCAASLKHGFGDRERKRKGPLTAYPSFHGPERWYTMSRNRIPMIKTYGLKLPHWLSYEIVASLYTWFRMLVFEDCKIDKIIAIVRGTFDGLRGISGPPPWANT